MFDASVGVGLTLSLERYPVDPSIVETHDNVATLAAAGVRRALVDADWSVAAELARARDVTPDHVWFGDQAATNLVLFEARFRADNQRYSRDARRSPRRGQCNC